MTHSPDHDERADVDFAEIARVIFEASRDRFMRPEQCYAAVDALSAAGYLCDPAALRGRNRVVEAEAVTNAIRTLRCVSAHATEDADEIGQSITATEAAEALAQTWLRLQALWKEMAFPRDPVHGALMDDEMDRLLGARAALHDAKEA